MNEAEEQEFREAALAYFFLLTRAGAAGWNREHLDDAIEEFLEQTAKIKVDFEIGDAVDKLVHFQLVENRGDGLLYAVPLREGGGAGLGLDSRLARVHRFLHHPACRTPASQCLTRHNSGIDSRLRHGVTCIPQHFEKGTIADLNFASK